MTTAGRRELEKEKRRNSIITAAEKLFFSKGFDNVSLKEIAKEADMGRSTVYLYFENKEELFFAIVLKGTQFLHEMIMTETGKVKTCFDKLAAFRKAYYTFAQQFPDYLKAYNYLVSGRFDLANIEPGEHKIEFIADSKFYPEMKKMLETGYMKSLEQGNIPNFPIPKFTVSEYLNEILILRREMLNVINNSLESGKKEGTIRKEVNTVEATVLMTLIANSIDNLPPDLQNLLDYENISPEKFLVDVGEFLGYMVSNRKYD